MSCPSLSACNPLTSSLIYTLVQQRALARQNARKSVFIPVHVISRSVVASYVTGNWRMLRSIPCGFNGFSKSCEAPYRLDPAGEGMLVCCGLPSANSMRSTYSGDAMLHCGSFHRYGVPIEYKPQYVLIFTKSKDLKFLETPNPIDSDITPYVLLYRDP